MSQCISTMGESYGLAGFSTGAQPAVAIYVSSESYRQPRKRKAMREDTGLVDRLKAGDQRALEAIFNLYSTRLYNVAHRILGDLADAEEVIQDVFWTAFRKAKTFQGTAQFSTWLYRLTVNAALGRIRRSKKKKEVEYEEYLPKFQDDGHHLVRPVVDWSDTLDEKYAHHEAQHLLARALDELKPLDKSVVVLSDLEGMSDKEIAVTLGLTVSAVKTRLHRARLFLRGKLAVSLGYSAA
ncbi:MAG TPA: sigma-70 family RNA polymerase sigma factor [Methylomirabilota bacterium]|nr:sigma-70 family RNA polymerase sigma factor [Methylomirabilota bacterium]